uniref:Non-structural maintenance of chromosomes element 4 n=1 Tax=Peronospora matthiolae TaxID=2874970 RepID=A0AAV1TU48_9STRA
MTSDGKKRRRRASSDNSEEEAKTQRTIPETEVAANEVAAASPRGRVRARVAPPGRARKGFLEQSQLSEKDRRHVRYKERELLQSLKENAGELATLSSDTFDAHTQELDQMYEHVCYPREANLDASNLDELNVAVTKQSQALGSSDLTKYETTEFIRATREVCVKESGHQEFDWNALGNAAGACFRSVPEISFLFGLMDTEVTRKERKKSKRAQDDVNAQEAQPTEYTNKKDRRDAQARRLEILQSTLIQHECRQPLFDMVINPKSFTQTVENLFDTSFLVRNNSAEIGVDDDTGLPYLKNQEGMGEANIPASTQSIISITPAQWQQLAQMTGREEPVLGHRA